MLPRFDTGELLDEIDTRQSFFDADPDKRERVREILSTVRTEGWTAVQNYSREFDSVEPDAEPLTKEVQQEAWKGLSDDQQRALTTIKKRVKRYQDSIAPSSTVITDHGEGLLGEVARPIENVGCYIPGGRVPLPSSVLMTAYVAELAGVKDLVVCSPPGAEGSPNDKILAALSLLDDPEIYSVGGAQAIGAMVFGAGSIDAIDCVAGPGNIYVTLAKKEVFGDVKVDMIAGPSEIAVLADPDSTNTDYVAWDLLSQAEHDPMSKSILLSLAEGFADRVDDRLEELLEDHPRPKPVREALDNSASVVVDSVEDGIELVNRIAPEHLELHVPRARRWSKQCRSAGAIFCGPRNPEPIGDYVAGPSHTLPTGGSARFFSPLSVRTFHKFQSLIAMGDAGFESVRDDATIVADMESLYAHRESVRVRE